MGGREGGRERSCALFPSTAFHWIAFCYHDDALKTLYSERADRKEKQTHGNEEQEAVSKKREQTGRDAYTDRDGGRDPVSDRGEARARGPREPTA